MRVGRVTTKKNLYFYTQLIQKSVNERKHRKQARSYEGTVSTCTHHIPVQNHCWRSGNQTKIVCVDYLSQYLTIKSNPSESIQLSATPFFYLLFVTFWLAEFQSRVSSILLDLK